MEAAYSIHKDETYVVLKIEAEKLDTHIAPSVKSQVVVLNSEGFRNIIFDLSQTRFCDSSGLSAILIAHRMCKEAGGTFVLACSSESVAKLIRISQLENVLTCTPTVNEAVDYIYMEELERGLNDTEAEP